MLANGEVAIAYMLFRVSGTLKEGREVDYGVRATVGCQRSRQRWSIMHEHISLPVDFETRTAVIDLVP